MQEGELKYRITNKKDFDYCRSIYGSMIEKYIFTCETICRNGNKYEYGRKMGRENNFIWSQV